MSRLPLIAASAGCLALAACSPLPSSAAASATILEGADLVGVASVVDGDTLDIRGERVRLYGIDAFESGQRCRTSSGVLIRCGRTSAMAMDAMVTGQTVYCRNKDRDRWGRRVAQCATTQTGDLGAALVAQGWAIAFTRYSQTYVAHEAQARSERRGAWEGAFDAPADWRAGRRTQASS
jgi:endonuclease YncB( thermonuclease family)